MAKVLGAWCKQVLGAWCKQQSVVYIMAKAKRPSDPEELMKLLLLEEEEEEEEEEAFKIGIDAIIQQHLQTLNQSYNRIQKQLLQTSSLIHSYNRLGKIHEVENDHVVFDHSSDAIQKEIESSIEVAQNITTIFKSILPRHTLDYVSDKKKFFLANFSKSENLKVSKFQKKTDFVRNKIVDLAVKLYNLRSSRIKSSIVESVQYGRFRQNGTLESVRDIEWKLYLWREWSEWSMKEEIEITEGDEEIEITEGDEVMMKIEITERDEVMMKIEKAMEDLEGILFGIYVMVQTQVAISAYAAAAASAASISDGKSPQWFGTGHHDDIKSLAAAEETKKKTLSMQWFKSKIMALFGKEPFELN